MRIYFLLIITAIALSFSTAYFALNLEKNNIALKKDIVEIEGLAHAFVNLNKAQAVLDLSSMYPTRDLFQLINPISIYSNSDVVVQDAFVSRPCHKTSERMSKLSFDKNEIWEDYRCLRISRLPAPFFEAPPLIHDSGISFAFFAYSSGREPFNTPEWIKGNVNYFHVSELKLLPPMSLEGNFKILSMLSKNDFEEIVTGAKHILSKDFYLTKLDSDRDINYNVYPRVLFDNFLKEKSYFIKEYKPGAQCFYQDGKLCWEKTTNNILQIFKRSSIIIFLTSMLVLFLIAIILFKKIRQQKFEEERKRHALRVLTHELRTPISNLLLQVEMINKQSDIIPATILEDFLKMESEVYRLKRLAEKSSSYLQTHEAHVSAGPMNTHSISINHLLSEMLETYTYKDKNIQFQPLGHDQSINVDVYWLNICLKNLIENAFLHGLPPVKVSLVEQKDYLRIEVENGGSCPYSSLEEMLKADRVGKTSSGLGVGLSIVQKIMHEMNGKLLFTKNPTTFSLLLRKIPKESGKDETNPNH